MNGTIGKSGTIFAALAAGALAFSQAAGPQGDVVGSHGGGQKSALQSKSKSKSSAAQKQVPPVVQKGQGAKELKARLGQRPQWGKFRQELLNRLNLSLEQKRQIGELNERFVAQMQSLRASGGDKRGLLPKARALMREHRQSVLNVLTPEQRQRLQELVRDRLAKVKSLRSKNPPPGTAQRQKGRATNPPPGR